MIATQITSVSSSAKHGFSKQPRASIQLLAGLGVEGDAHAGATVRHRYLVRRDPTQPNLCQVHLLPAELLAELATAGFTVHPGDLGENVTTRGLDLCALPTGTLLRLGGEAVVELTGLRTPCLQLDQFHPGLQQAVTVRDAHGRLLGKAGVMAIVRTGGVVTTEDVITVDLPPLPHLPLGPV